jgi:rhodanese-related sulfurtransferase
VAGGVAAQARAGLAEAWSADDLARRRRRVTVVDVRPAGRSRAGSVAGAVAVPLETLRARLSRLKGPQLLFVCDTGRLAYLAARIARQHGRPAAYLSGGLVLWAAEGRPLRSARP